MDHYYVNKQQQPNGDHEVHIRSCYCLPTVENQLVLGRVPLSLVGHSSGEAALFASQRRQVVYSVLPHAVAEDHRVLRTRPGVAI